MIEVTTIARFHELPVMIDGPNEPRCIVGFVVLVPHQLCGSSRPFSFRLMNFEMCKNTVGFVSNRIHC